MESEKEKREGHEVESTRLMAYTALAIGIVALIVLIYALLSRPSSTSTTALANKTTNVAPIVSYNIKSSLITPPSSLASAPVITQQQPFGHRLTNINQPFNASELSAINNASDSFFEKAGEMLLNGSIDNQVGIKTNNVQMFIVNGKPSVIYLGSITCLVCGENSWAVALALSRFGSFSALYKGYTSFGDADLPTVYWAPAYYNSSGKDSLGNFYSSKYINFISIDDENPITSSFDLNPLNVISSNINASDNLAYEDAFSYIINYLGRNSSTAFQGGTPYMVWGSKQVNGADAFDVGNSTPAGDSFPLQRMTHFQVISQLANPNDQFAWTEYAAADLYVAMVCTSINNAAPVCSLPAIEELETYGY
ncbi:MAG: DUF929 family protein [Candidatus Micrarchaeia archaeon]